MTRQPVADRLKHNVAGMVALEARTEALFGRLRGEVQGHLGAASALERYHATSEAQRDRLKAHLWALGGEAGAAEAGGPPSGSAPGTPDDAAPRGAASRALRDAYVALNEAAFGYGVLHETAHVVDSVRYASTIQLAERHLRAYTAAAQEINQLLADVVAWELRQEGQFCDCRCPSCELGICWCVAHTTDAINAAWRDTAPAYPSAGLRVAPNPRRPPDLDVREGDLVIAVDGQRVATTSDVTSAVMSHAPGEPIRLGIERRSVGALEVVATRK
jgi:PDZ domain